MSSLSRCLWPRSELARCFLVLIVLVLLWIRVETWSNQFRRNLFYLTYNDAFLSAKVKVGTWLRPELLDELKSRDLCHLGNLAAYYGDIYAEKKYRKLSRDVFCNYITFINKKRVILNLPKFLHRDSSSVFDRGSGQIEFRRNASVWGWVYLRDSRRYRIGVEARCTGPESAILETAVGSYVFRAKFDQVSSQQHFDVFLSEGVYQMRLAFRNDYDGPDGDRNLRLIEVWFE